MKLTLSARPNADFPEGTWEAKVSLDAIFEVGSFREASQKAREWIADNDLGGGNFHGEVEGLTVSYNGRIWPSGVWTTAMRPVYDPLYAEVS